MKLQNLLADRESLERQIGRAKREGRARAVALIVLLMAEYDVSPAEVEQVANKGSGDRRTRKVPIKYRNVATGDVWSGRGLRPRWLRAELARGKQIDDFAVDAPLKE